MRKWHVAAWMRGGCAACGTDTRDSGTVYAHWECADAFNGDDWRSMRAAIDADAKQPAPAMTSISVELPPAVAKTVIFKDYFATPDHSALLLRAASFLADLPSGSLDRVRNVEAMNLIRALRDAVVPADKVRK